MEGDGTGSGDGTGTDDGATQDWRELVPESLRNNPILKKIRATTVEGLARVVIGKDKDLQKRPAADALVIPDDDADEEVVSAYRERRGIPADGDGYDFGQTTRTDPTKPDQMPVRLNPELVRDFRQLASELQLTQDQARKVVEFQVGRLTELQEATEAEVNRLQEEGYQALEQQYGNSLPDKIKSIGNVLQAILPEDPNNEGQPEPQAKERLDNLLKQTNFPGGLGASADFKAVILIPFADSIGDSGGFQRANTGQQQGQGNGSAAGQGEDGGQSGTGPQPGKVVYPGAGKMVELG